MALLQGGKRTATVTAARRAHLLAIDKPAFDQLFLKSAKAIEYFARVLSKRLAGVTRGDGSSARRRRSGREHPWTEGRDGDCVSLATLLEHITATEVIFVEVRPGDEAPHPTGSTCSRSLGAAARRSAPPSGALGRPTLLRIAVPDDLTLSVRRPGLEPGLEALRYFSFIVFDLGS